VSDLMILNVCSHLPGLAMSSMKIGQSYVSGMRIIAENRTCLEIALGKEDKSRSVTICRPVVVRLA